MGLFEQETKVERDFPFFVEPFALQEVEKARLQRQNIEAQQAFQSERLAELPDLISAEAQAREAAIEGTGDLLDTSRTLIEQAADRAAGGVSATAEQRQLIEEQARRAIQLGESDINRFLKETGTMLREELSPSLNLRPTDSPILDRGQRAREEAIRQQGQLVGNVRQAQTQQLLDFPIEAGRFETERAATTTSMSEAVRQFQQQLAQQAFQNRLLLTGQVGEQGIALSSLRGNPPIFSTGSTTTVDDPLGTTAALLGGVGGLLQGIGS